MADTSRVLIHNCGSGLGQTVARELAAQGAALALHDAQRAAAAASLAQQLSAAGGRVIDVSAMPIDAGDVRLNLAAIAEHCGGLDALVNLFVPAADTHAAELQSYTEGLYARGMAAGEVIARHTHNGIIVNQFFLPSMFADTPLSAPMVRARAAVTATTRIQCLRHGKAGVRAVGLLAGLFDGDETRSLLSERVQATTTPLQRWITAEDVAKSVAFLVLESGYITGQMLILDGGLSAGINGT